MILSFNIPEWRAYQAAALALYEVERDIENRQHSKHAVDLKIMPRLIEKRDRLQCEVAPLKAAADAAEQKLRAALEPKPPVANTLTRPASSPPNGDDLDIPAFLRRQAC